MMILLLSMGCLFDSSNAMFQDLDGDGLSVNQGDCNDNNPNVAGPIANKKKRNYETIQDAVDDSSAGDTITICPPIEDGDFLTFQENLVLPHDLEIKGLAPAGVAPVIDGGGQQLSVITVQSSATISGVVLTGGTGTTYEFNNGAVLSIGGGVEAVNASSLTLTDVVMENNQANYGGALFGPFSADAQVTLEQVTLSDNTATDIGGGAFLVGSATIIDSVVTSNRSTQGSAGGLNLQDGSFTLSGTQIRDNSASVAGGGLLLFAGDLAADNMDIGANSPDDVFVATADGANGNAYSPGGSFSCTSNSTTASCN